MANIDTKYDYGQPVSCHGVPGMITAIFLRGAVVSYEFSYISRDGDPRGCTVGECELGVLEDNAIGFNNSG